MMNLKIKLRELGNFSINKKIILLLFLLMLLARIAYIQADAPIYLYKSPDVFTDEGYKTYSARNMALFKTYFLEGDEYGKWLRTNPVTHLFYIPFLIFGVGYVQARITVILFSLLTLIFFYGLIKKSFGQRVALLSTFFLGFSYMFIMYNRLALFETIMIFFLILSLYLWKIGIDSNKPFYYFFSFVCLILAYFVKALALFFIPVLIVMCYFGFIRGLSIKKLKKNKFVIAFIILIFLGIILLLIPKFLLDSIHILSWKDSSIYMVPVYLARLIKNPFFGNTIVLSVLSLIYPIFLISKFSKHKKINPVEIIFLTWIISLVCSFSLAFLHQPRPRYLILFIPAMSLLSTLVLTNLTKIKSIKIDKKNFLFNILLIIWISAIFIVLLVNFYPLFKTYLQYYKIYYAIYSIIFSLIVSYFLFIIFSKISIKLKKGIAYKFIAFVIILFVLVNMGQYLNWYLHPNYTLIESSKELTQLLPKNAVILGGWAPALCLETDFKCYNAAGKSNIDEGVFKRLNVTHLILRDEGFVDVDFKENPNYNKSIKLVKEFKIAARNINLYEFDQSIYYQKDTPNPAKEVEVKII